MEMAFQKTAFPCMTCAVREVQNAEQTQELRLPDGMPDIGKVLCAWGQVILRSKEWRSDSVLVSGGMLMWVLYLPEDGSEPRSLDGWLPFQTRWLLPQDCPEGTIRVLPLTRFADARSVSPRKMMLRAGVALQAEVWVPRSMELVQPGSAPDGVELLHRRYPVRLPREAGEKTFELDESLSCTAEPERLLYYCIRPEVTEQKVLANKIAFRGSCTLHMVWLEADGRVGSQDYSMAISQIADLEHSLSSEAQADVVCCVTNLELEKEDGGFRVRCGLTAQYLADDLEVIETVEDAYAPGRALRQEKQSLELPAILEKRGESVLGSVQLPVNGSEVEDAVFLPDFPRQYREGDSVALEIPGTVQLLLRDGEGKLRSVSARWEGKFSCAVGPDAVLSVSPQCAPIPQLMNMGENAAVNATLPLQLTAAGGTGIPMVTELELGAASEPDPSRPSLILRRAGVDSLWEIAKKCGSTVDAIRTANGLQEEPKPGQMLLIPIY